MVLNSPFTKILYVDRPPTAPLEQSLRAICGAASWAAVLILPQIKLNSQLSHWASFSVDRFKHIFIHQNRNHYNQYVFANDK